LLRLGLLSQPASQPTQQIEILAYVIREFHTPKGGQNQSSTAQAQAATGLIAACYRAA
jgi:hypothetical protein